MRQSTIRKEIRSIRRSFLIIARAIDRIAPALSEANAAEASAMRLTKSGRKKPKLSPAQRRALKLQGRYMGTMRGLKPREQSKVKAMRKSRGINAAITLAGKLAAR